MSITGVISSFDSGAFTITRPAGGAHVNGEWVDGTPTSVPVPVANVQPVTGRDLEALEEGRRESGVVLMLTETEVRAKDTFVYKGSTWECFQVDSYDAFGESWYEALFARQTVP